MRIDSTAARHIMLAAQGLSIPPSTPAAKAGVLDAIRRMGALQIDTIHVVARSPYLVLWSRLGDYRPEWLDELLAEGQVFEYWAHAACFQPREDFPLARRLVLERMHGWWYNADHWLREHADVIERVLSRIRDEGPRKSADFENENHTSGGWWDWKEEKIALEVLFTLGEVMVARREKFQRVYDLRERVRPDWDDAQTPSFEEVKDELTLKAVRALGVAPSAWIPDYFRLKKTGMEARLKALVQAGRLEVVDVEGWSEPGYVHPDHLGLLEQAAAGGLEPTLTTLLSPFDPLVWDRKRALAMFGFDYTIECYTPAPKRRYGYFTLPILHRGRLVGRLDPKAHRKEGIFEVKALHLEPGVELTNQLITDLREALQRIAAWHNTPEIVVREANSELIKGLLEEGN